MQGSHLTANCWKVPSWSLQSRGGGASNGSITYIKVKNTLIDSSRDTKAQFASKTCKSVWVGMFTFQAETTWLEVQKHISWIYTVNPPAGMQQGRWVLMSTDVVSWPSCEIHWPQGCHIVWGHTLRRSAWGTCGGLSHRDKNGIGMPPDTMPYLRQVLHNSIMNTNGKRPNHSKQMNNSLHKAHYRHSSQQNLTWGSFCPISSAQKLLEASSMFAVCNSSVLDPFLQRKLHWQNKSIITHKINTFTTGGCPSYLRLQCQSFSSFRLTRKSPPSTQTAKKMYLICVRGYNRWGVVSLRTDWRPMQRCKAKTHLQRHTCRSWMVEFWEIYRAQIDLYVCQGRWHNPLKIYTETIYKQT